MTVPAASSPVPWRPGDATRLLLLDVVGGSTVVGGWLGTSETAGLSRQLGWVSLAVVGLLIAGAGSTLWLLAGRRAVGLRLKALLETYPPAVLALVVVPAVTPLNQGVVVSVAKGSRYHQPDCLLVRGKPTHPVPAPDLLRPCEACLPDKAA